MRRNSGSSFRNYGAYTSPGTPEYGDNGGVAKAWSSERVPLPTSRNRSHHISAAALMPFNSGRTLPSKWDDAERWITSPVSGYGAFRNSAVQAQKRPISKSGPLGPTGVVYFPQCSPSAPAQDEGNMRNFMGKSPLTTGVLLPDSLSVHFGAGNAANTDSVYTGSGNNIYCGTGVPGLTDLLSKTSEPSSPDEKHDSSKEEDTLVSHRDMATQMSPDGSTRSSSKGRLSFSVLHSSVPPSSAGRHENPAEIDEIRDVQVDKGTTTSRSSKKNGLKKIKESRNAAEYLSSSWNTIEESKNLSKLQREEARIAAWENLQKAKAEAAIRKLEMKLEKKRSASMDKITQQLRNAEMKAQVMRNVVPDRASATSHKGLLSWICFHCN